MLNLFFTRNLLCLFLVLQVCPAALSSGALGAKFPSASTANSQDQPRVSGQEQPKQRPGDAVTEADRIARLQATIAADEKSLVELRAQLEKRRVEEEAAGTEFQNLTQQFEALTQQLQKAKDDSVASAVTQIEAKLKPLRTEQDLVKEKFDLAIAARRTAQQQITTLEAKAAQDKPALDKLKGIQAPVAETKLPDKQSIPSTSDTTPPTKADTPTGESTVQSDPTKEQKKTPETKAEREARRVVEKKEKALDALEQDLENLVESKGLLENNIELESQTLETVRKQYDNLEKELETAEANFNERLSANAPQSELQQLRQRIAETQQQLGESRMAIRQSTDRLQGLRNQLLALQKEETVLVKQSEELRRQAQAAKRSELYVSVQQFVINTGPKLLATLLVILVLWLFLKLVCSRAKKWIDRDASGTTAERKHRSQTLIGVFQNTGNAAIIVGGILMMLDAVGVPIAPLLGGAGVVGLAIAFAAQSLVKDYFCGFILLLENQFKIGDNVTINGMTGTVERITLRITVLRNVDGHVFYIPNGQITAVKNSTEGWARVVLDVGVAYGENIDNVIEILITLANEFTSDAKFSDFILGEPEMFGVDALADSSVVVRLGLKVQPDRQWAIKRELLRRIKSRFDDLGIEIPFPQQTVHHRMENGEQASASFQPPIGGTNSSQK
ncbi:MAG: small-conductance mechanosensitive channel [Mariniblastus sp.]|jgi:small-conductance mechanosensitive channel